jgi:hypothetical protein
VGGDARRAGPRDVPSLLGDQQVAFRITGLDDRGEWTIDGVDVDPYNKG